MSQEPVSTPSLGAAGAGKINPDPLVFFQTILVTMKNRPEVDWNVVAKKVGYNSAETAKARFRQMKRKFNEDQSDAPLSSAATSKARAPPKVVRTNRRVTNSSPPMVIKAEPFASRSKNADYKKAGEVKRSAKRVKVEAKADGGGTDSSFADVDDFDSE